MIKILGKEYISDKEAEHQFGFSREWFKKQRSLKKGPPYIKLEGKVLYCLIDIETWFKDRVKHAEDM